MKNYSFKYSLLCLALFTLCISCKKEEKENLTTPTSLTPFIITNPSYFPQLQNPYDNPLTLEGIQLGRRLYYDPILSNNGKSCSTCHTQSNAFSDPIVNSLAHMNLGWNNKFLWNGAVEGQLEDAMKFEVEVFFNTDITKLNSNGTYKVLFAQVFNSTTITKKQVADALAQYFRAQTSTNSRMDKYLRHEIMLTASELNGFVIYSTEKGDCFHCHSIGLFNDNAFHNIGIDSVFSGVNSGRYNVTLNPSDKGKFKTPTLRNVELTAPYMHDGRFTSLQQVVEHYNSGVKLSATVDPIMTKPSHQFGLQLTSQEKTDLVSFLKALTDTSFTNNPLLSSPF